MTISSSVKITLIILFLTIFLSNPRNLSAQNLESFFKDSENVEKDLWKKERFNYYLDNREVNETYSESFFYRGQEKLQEGLYADAIADFKKAIATEKFAASTQINATNGPSYQLAYLSISLCFQQIDQIDSALFYCEKSIDKDKYYLDAYIEKAAILVDMNKAKKASAFLDEAEEIFPDSKRIYYTKAQVYLQQDKIPKAKRYLKKTSEIDPDFDEASVLLATIYIYEHNVTAALRILTKSINSGKKPLTSLYYRAMIYEAKDQMYKAYLDLNRAYNLDTVNNPVTGKLFIMDYYHENYRRANKLGKDLWKKAYLKDSVIVNWIDYVDYEIGYLLKYVNDTSSNPSEIEVYNSLMNKSMHKKDALAVAGVEEYSQKNASSIFANRLKVFVLWFDNSDKILYKGEYYVNDFSKEPRISTKFSDYSDQTEEIIRALSQDSSIISLYWLKSIYELEQGKYEKGIESATQGILLDSNFLEPFKSRGYCNLRLKNYSSAIADFNRVIEASSVLTATDFPLAYSYFKIGNYEEALKINTKVIDTKYPDAMDLHNQGLCYELNNMPDSALKYFGLASKRFSTHSEYTRSMVRIHRSQGDYDLALEVLTEANDREYSDFMLLVDIADLYAEMGDYEEAITYYKKAYREDKSYTYAYIGAADCHRRLGEYETALQLYDIAIMKMPDHAYTYYAKGLCYLELRDYKKSNENAFEATQLNDEYAAAYQLMAENFFILGRYSVSVSMGLNALKYDPGNKDIMYQLAASTLAKGNTDEAIGFYKRIIETENLDKSTAYNKAIVTLKMMISYNIQLEGAKLALETVFGESE